MEDDPLRKPRWRVWLFSALAIFAVLGAGVVATPFALDTASGKRWLASRIEQTQRTSGLTVRIGGIEGSLWSRLTLRDLVLGDDHGSFAAIRQATLVWQPAALARRQVRIASLRVPQARLNRWPALKPSDEPGLLDDLALQIDEARIDSLALGPELMGGTQRTLRIHGSGARADGLLRLRLDTREQASQADSLRADVDYHEGKRRLRLDASALGTRGGTLARLLGLDAALSARLAGNGTLDGWTGRLTAQTNTDLLADLALDLSASRVRLSGTLHPTPALPVAVADLTGGPVAVQLAAVRASEDWRLDGAATSPRARLRLAGGLGRDNWQARAMTLSVRMAPGPLLPATRADLVSDGLVAQARLDGALTRPTIRLGLVARSAGIEGIRLTGLRLGAAGVLGDTAAPLHIDLRATPVTGDPDLDRLAGPMQVRGPLVIAATGVETRGKGLRVTAASFAGRVQARYALSTGAARIQAAGISQPAAQRYLGSAPVATVLALDRATRDRPFAGPVRLARLSRPVDRWHRLAGGAARLSASALLARDGTVRLDRLVLTAGPNRLGGDAALRPDGRISARLAGDLSPGLLSRAGVPLALTRPASVSARIDGRISAPAITARLTTPDAQAGPVRLTDLVLTLDSADARSWSATLSSGTHAGPLQATAGLDLRQPVRLTDLDARLAGLRATGTLTLTPHGPLEGRLALAPDAISTQTSGSLSASLDLSAAGSAQHLALRATARKLDVRTTTPLSLAALDLTGTGTIGSARDAFSLDGSASGLRSGRWDIRSATLRAAWRDNALAGTWTARGRRNVPFDLAGDVTARRERGWSLRGSFDGTIAGQAAGSVDPVVARIGLDDWRLEPAILRFGASRMTLSGQGKGRTAQIHAGLAKTPLEVADLFFPRLDLSGKASGALDMALLDGRPVQADLRLTVEDAKRASLSLTAIPVDAAIAARLDQQRLTAEATLSLPGRDAGSIRLTAFPIAANRPFRAALLEAPVDGRIQWTGPAEAVWGFTALDGHDLRGDLAIDATVGGRLGDPDLRGTVSVANGRYEALMIGLRASNVTMRGHFEGPRLTIDSASAQTKGKGRISATGWAELSADTHFPMELTLALDNAAVLGRDDLEASATGSVFMSHGEQGGRIDGKLTVPRGRIRVGPAASQIVELDVIEKNRDALPEPAQGVLTVPVRPWRLNLDLAIRDRFAVEGMGLSSFWSGRLRLRGTSSEPNIIGRLALDRGNYDFAGRRFEITRGALIFTGGAGINPTLDILATHRLSDVTGRIEVSGQARKPTITFSSEPALPQDEVVARLLFGDSVANLSAIEALQLADALETLRTGGRGSVNLVSRFRKAIRIDRLRFDDRQTVEGAKGTTVTGGKYLSDRVYVELTTDGQGYTATQLEFELTRALSILSRVATLGGTNVLLRWSKDY